MDLTGKTIALGIPGGIAAYRVCDLVRELYRRNAARVIATLTPSATEFVTPLTLQALTREKVYTNELAVDDKGIPIHIALAQQADIFVIIPATTNMLGKMANGLADDLVSTTAMTFTNKPVLIVPAMNSRMWKHPIAQKNLETLEALDFVTVIPPTSGELACGETGDGHLADQEIILQHIYRLIHPQASLYKGIRAIVTAGGTQDPIDPVRMITNRSSGKMGIALADELYGMGAEVTLISTNNQIQRPYPMVYVERMDEMRIAVENRFSSCEMLMMAAAVSDFVVTKPSKQKIKRHEGEEITLSLAATQDILATLGKRKKSSQLLVGFAAESQHLFQNARDKLERKNLDLIIANDISRGDIGFQSDFNEVTMLFRDKEQISIPRQSKDKVASEILTNIHQKLLTKKNKAKSTKDSTALKPT